MGQVRSISGGFGVFSSFQVRGPSVIDRSFGPVGGTDLADRGPFSWWFGSPTRGSRNGEVETNGCVWRPISRVGLSSLATWKQLV